MGLPLCFFFFFFNILYQAQRITLKGFIVFDYAKQYPAALKDLASWLAQGKIRRKEYIIKGGLEAAPQGLVGLYQGANTGKTMVEIAPLDQAIGAASKL